MVYGREIDGETLELEASGALLEASLVMRDRQTDSWWALMSSQAIGGPLEGTKLPEIAGSVKTTWGEWRAKHPDTLVLSVDGREHVPRNPYDGYFRGADTFRGAAPKDDRLPAKEPVYGFELDGRKWAIPHSAVAGGVVIELPEGTSLILHREHGAPIFASTNAWILTAAGEAREMTVNDLLHAIEQGDVAAEQLTGFDTFWYTWVGVNESTELLERH